MTVLSSSEISVDPVSYRVPGASVYTQVQQSTNITSWPSASSAKVSFVLPPNVRKLPSSYLAFTSISTAVSGIGFMGMHTGFLSPFSAVKLFETSNQNVLYQQEEVAPLSKLRNRTHYSLDEAMTFSKNLTENVAAPTAITIETNGGAGGLLQLALSPAGATGVSITGVSLPSYAVDDAGTGQINLACAQPVQNVLFGFATGTTTTLWGMNAMIPLSDFGGIFSIDKYLPFAGEQQLDITFAPANQALFVTNAQWLQAGAVASANAQTLSNIRLLLDTANDTISSQAMGLLAEGSIVVPHPVMYQNVRAMPANQNPVSAQIAVSGFLGSKLRSIWSGVFSTAASGGAYLNLDNTTAVKWDGYRSYWNNKPLQNDIIDYKDAYLYQKEVLKGGLYQSGRDFKANPQIIDDFCGVPMWDKNLFSADMGLPLTGTTNTYTIMIYRTTGVATARNLYTYVEVQRDLVLSKSGAVIMN